MDVYMCDHCGCEIKEKKPKRCPLCKKQDGNFSKTVFPDPDPAEQQSSKKYREAMQTLDQYEEGCEPQKIKYAFEE